MIPLSNNQVLCNVNGETVTYETVYVAWPQGEERYNNPHAQFACTDCVGWLVERHGMQAEPYYTDDED